MSRCARWLLIIGLAALSPLLLSAEWSFAYIYGQVGSEPHPPDGTVTFMAYVKKGTDADNEILTEDNFAASEGLDRGYQSGYFFVNWENFDAPPTDGDTLVVLLTGIGSQDGNSGSVDSTVNTGLGYQEFPGATWGTSSNPAVPTGLQAENVSPGVVNLSWSSTKQGTYRLYRSSQASGAGNGASIGRYERIAQGLTDTSYQDSSAPLSRCWYILVAADSVAPDSILLSGHCDEVSIDAALPVQLTSFTASGGQGKVILEWITETEWDNQGFHIYRREEWAQDFQRITQELIPGAGNTTESQVYCWEDRQVEVGRTYWYQLESVDFHGRTQTYGPVSASPVDALPKTCRLHQNYPNPFNPQTWIGYQVPQAGQVTVTIFNVRGQLVKILVDEEQIPGYYRVSWNGQNLHGVQAASGIYFCQLKSGSFVETIKMVLLR